MTGRGRFAPRILAGNAIGISAFLASAALQLSGYQSPAAAIACGIVAVVAFGYAAWNWRRSRRMGRNAMQKIGSDTVVLGNVSADVGDRSVCIAPPAGSSSVILNQGGVAIGYGARADATSIAIGAFANAGVTPNKTPEK